MQFQLLFEQFYILGSIHSGVRQNEIQTSSTMTQHGTPKHMAQWAYFCGYIIFLVKMLAQWLSNVHVARYKLLHGAFIRNQHFLPLCDSPVAMTSGRIQSNFSGGRCGFCAGLWDFSQNSLLKHIKTVLELIAVPLKHKITDFLSALWQAHYCLSLECSSQVIVFHG